MAPEAIIDQPSTPKVDMWALGVILYQLSANKRPFEAENSFELQKLIRENEPAPLPPTVLPLI